MVTITLTPELEHAIKERAQRQGTTPELIALEKLQEQFLTPVTPPSISEDGTMADFLADYIGCIDSREFIPGGANLSQDTGRKFSKLLLKKHREATGEC